METLIDFYCPACGEASTINIGAGGRFLLSPGEDVFECPECHAEFTVGIQFAELEPVTDNSNFR